MQRRDIETDFNETATGFCINPLCQTPQTRIRLTDGMFQIVCDSCGAVIEAQGSMEAALFKHRRMVECVDLFLHSLGFQAHFKAVLMSACSVSLSKFMQSVHDDLLLYEPESGLNIGEELALAFISLLQYAVENSIDLTTEVAALLSNAITGK